MTPSQQNNLEFVFKLALVLVPIGVAWGVLTAALKNKAEQSDLQAHITIEAVKVDSVKRETSNIISGLCVGEKNQYRRLYWDCDRREIR